VRLLLLPVCLLCQTAGLQFRLSGLEASRGAVAVQLDLVDPALTGRRLVREGGELGGMRSGSDLRTDLSVCALCLPYCRNCVAKRAHKVARSTANRCSFLPGGLPLLMLWPAPPPARKCH
jgi:hypothetical protein